MGETRHVAMRFFDLVPYHVGAVDRSVSQVRSVQSGQVGLVAWSGQLVSQVRSGNVDNVRSRQSGQSVRLCQLFKAGIGQQKYLLNNFLFKGSGHYW